MHQGTIFRHKAEGILGAQFLWTTLPKDPVAALPPRHVQSGRNHTMRMKIPGTVLASLALVSIMPPAKAETTVVTVSYADLDLTTTAGLAVLDDRIRDAATRLCGLVDRDRIMLQTKARCIRDTVDSVRPQLEALRSRPILSSSRSILLSRSARG